MIETSPYPRAILDALGEPAIIVENTVIRLANAAARDLLGPAIEGRDVRLAIRHPQALDRILGRDEGDFELAGIGDPGRAWRLGVRILDRRYVLVRMIERTNAVSAEKMRVDFVANASHELRTPLSTVIGYAETLAEDDGLAPELRNRFSQTIADEARRMLQIIQDLMSLSRIEADRFVAPTGLVDIADVLAKAQANTRLLLESRACLLEVTVEPDVPTLRADLSQLVQVVENLLTNAARYGTREGRCAIRLSATHDRHFVRIEVADSGAGVAKEHLPRLTERFYRVDAARSRDSGGTGLGLAIVKHIVERHRGTLEISSEPGEGTSVVVRLPAEG